MKNYLACLLIHSILISASSLAYDYCPGSTGTLPSDVEIQSIQVRKAGETQFSDSDIELGIFVSTIDPLTPASPQSISITPGRIVRDILGEISTCSGEFDPEIPAGSEFRFVLKHSRAKANWGSISATAARAWAAYGSALSGTEGQLEITVLSGPKLATVGPEQPGIPYCSNDFQNIKSSVSSMITYLAGAQAAGGQGAQRVVSSSTPRNGGVAMIDFEENGGFTYQAYAGTCATTDGELTAVNTAFFPLQALAPFGLTADVLSVFDAEILPLAFSAQPQPGQVLLSFSAIPSYGEYENPAGLVTSETPTGIFFEMRMLNDGQNNLLSNAGFESLASAKGNRIGLKKSAIQAIGNCTKGKKKKARMQKGAKFVKKGKNISCKRKGSSIKSHHQIVNEKAESKLFKNTSFPFIKAEGNTCSEDFKNDQKFTLRLITNGSKAVGLIPNGAVSGTIKGASATLSSRKEAGDLADGSWSVTTQNLKLSKITSSALTANYQLHLEDLQGKCNLTYKGQLKRAK